LPLFRYEIADRNGKVLSGVISAASEADARQRLISRGYRVLTIILSHQGTPRTPQKAATSGVALRKSRISVSPRELAVFFRSLEGFAHSGMTLYQALVEIEKRTPNRAMRKVALRMASRVEAGDRLSNAMMEFPRAFPPNVVGTISAAEIGGFLPAVLGDLAFTYELSERASSRWLRLAIRLGWLNAIGTLIVSPLVPTMFTPGVEDYQGWIAAYLHFTVSRIIMPIGVLVFGYHLLAAIFRQPAMRTLRDALILKVPTHGTRSRVQSLAMFLRILWRLQSAGILPIQAWEAASHAAENSVVASNLHAQVPTIRSGAPFSKAMAASGYFSADDVRVLTASELSGQTVLALERLCAQYEDAAKTWAARAKWWAIHPVLVANIIAVGYAFYSISVRSILNQFKWVDWFFKTE